MSNMPRPLKTLALGFALTMAQLPAAAVAVPHYDRTVTYFDENGYTTGVYTINCNGASNLVGYRTEVFSVTEIKCESWDFN